MLKKLLFTLSFVAFLVPFAFAQTGTITGTVINQEGEPVPTANVLLLELGLGDATNLEGEFSIDGVEPGTYTLRVTFVGYRDFTEQVTVEAGETTTVDVQLQASAVGLEELIVTGFGEQSRIEFSGSVAQVNAEKQIENVPVVNVTTALQGSVTGLQVSASSGTPGEEVDINIRGINSINAQSNPLIVIDGVPVITGSFQAGDATSNIGLLSMVNPASIKSVTVLKGPVATAQYGARGSNGVIVITTKRGTAGETQYTFSLQRGTVSRAVDGPESLNAFQAAELYVEGLIHAGILPPSAQDSYDIPFWDGTTSTDWGALVTNDNAVTQSYMMSASGGSETATFYGALSYQQTDNIIINSNFERFQANINFAYDFNENIQVSNQFTGSYGTQSGTLEGAAFFGNPVLTRYFMPSFYPAFDDEGFNGFNLDLIPPIFNTVFTTQIDISSTRTTRVLNSTKLDIDITDNLAFHSEVGLDYVVNEEKFYRNPIHGDGADLNGTATGIYTRVFQGSVQNGLSYIWDINQDNSLELRAFQSTQIYEYYRISAFASGFPSLGLTNVASASVPRGAFSAAEDGALLSFLGKAHYGFKDKIFVDATIRYEGNSRFAPDFRWGLFYGVGAAWLLSSEDFLSNTEWLDLLKIRASHGITGNDAVGRNAFQAFLGFNAAYAGVGGIIPAQLGNIRLTWEKARETNAGLSVGLFNRVNADLTLFYSNTYDLLYNVPLSFTTGFTEQAENIGSLVNKGIELSMDVDVIRTEDFLLNVEGNFTWLSNEITELAEDAAGDEITIISPNFKYVAVEGFPIGSWYMKTYAGVDPATGMPLWEVNDGDDVLGELTSDYTKANAEYQGASGFPTRFGSIGLTVNYKGFYAGAELYGSFGNKVYDIWAGFLASDGNIPLFLFGHYANQLNRWQEPGDITDVPKRIFGSPFRGNSTSTRYLYDGDYLRLSTVRVGYNVPASLLNDIGVGIRGLNIFLVGRNLWTYMFDPELRHDPETGELGRLDLQNPSLQALTLGINIQL